MSGANYYWLTVATDPSYLPTDPHATNAPGCVIGSNGVGISGTSYTPSTPLDSGPTYYWKVQAYHGSDAYHPDRQGYYSEQWSYTTQQSLLPAPTLSNPPNGDTGISTTPTFSWSSVSGANYYWLTVATDPSYLPTDPHATNAPGCVIGSNGVGISGTSYTPSTPLDSGPTYYWKVQAYHGSDAYHPDRQGYYSEQWSYTTQQSLLPAPTLSNPPNGDTGISTTPTFSWSSVSGANYYWLTVATDPSYLPTDPHATNAPGCVIGSNGVGISGTSYTPSTPLDSGPTYYWKVQAYHGSDAYHPDRQGYYSEQWSYTTQQETPPENTINFYTNPQSVGSITFSGTTYTHGESGKYSSGTYSISANLPSGYDFKSWSTSGEILVASSTSSSTTAAINGDGSLTANFESSPSIEYNRQSAYNYAKKYAYKVCSDGYFFEASYPPSYLGAETPVPSECGFDCAHFVSCCIGAETHEQGGGLDVPCRTEAYGEPGADKLRKWLIDSGNAMYETAIGELEKGDVISYDWEGDGYFDHVVLYLDSGKIAAHSVSYWNANWDVYKQNHPNFNYKLIHIKGGEQQLTCAIELQKNGIPIDKVNVGQFFDIYVGDSSGSIAQVRFLSDEKQNDIVDEGFTWTEWYNWDISSGDWNAETKIMRWAFHTEGRKEVWAEVKDDVDQTTKCSANIITANLYWLAKAIMSEASIGTQEERIAVGWTVLNRFDSGNFGSSIEDVVKNGYAYNQEPTPEIIVLAKDLLERKIPDPTGGAIYFFSPISMPKEGEENKCKPPIGNGNMDCNGGLYQVPGTSEKIYFPSWAKPKEGWTVTDFYPTVEDLEWVSGLVNVRNWYFMFYRPISSLPLSAHIKVDKMEVWSGDEVTFNGSASTGQIASYKWNFGDGTIVEGSGKPDKVSNRFRGAMGNSKDYTVKLTVEDEKRATASDTVSITVYPLKRYIPVYSSLAPYLPPSVAMTPIMEITVYYNWVDEIEGQDEYIVSEVHLDSELSLSFALYMFSINDDNQKIWSKIHKGVGKEDVSFTYPFNVPRDCTKTFGNEHFKGLTVGSNSNLNFVVDGRELGLNLRPTFFRVSRTIELGPGKQTEVPSIYPEGKMAGITSALSSPVELSIYDSQGNVTGLVDGKIKEEIPNSIYDEESETIVIFSPEDINFYSYKVAGTEEGAYGLEISAVEDGEANAFAVTNFSTTNKTTHQYTINWSTQEATVQIDSDGDGEFEQNITLQPPVASFTYTPENPTVNQAITFNASSSYDPDGNITNYEWNFGDGTNGSGRITTHSYSSAGEYPVTLIITDNSSTLNSTTKIITIPDTTPPKSITNLTDTTGQTWINWTWTNPPDADFNYTVVYLNGTWKINTSDPYYNATGLNSNTFYEIGTHTVDKVGNVNATWVNQTAATISPCFIATAAYGTALHGDIDVLRDFRDEYLMPNPAGRTFVKIYYNTSPPLAEVIRGNEWLRTAVREGLVKPLVHITGMFV